jgi:hypothetical protein
MTLAFLLQSLRLPFFKPFALTLLSPPLPLCCLADILQNQWSPIYDVSAILTSIQSLLCDPNPARYFPHIYHTSHPHLHSHLGPETRRR